MQSIVFYNNKGGVGKTTLCFNYAMELAVRNPEVPVVLIDMDCQTNLSCSCLGGGFEGRQSVQMMRSAKRTISDLISNYMYPNRSLANFRIDDYLVNINRHRAQGWQNAFGVLNDVIPQNVFLICGSMDIDFSLEFLSDAVNARSNSFNQTPGITAMTTLKKILVEYLGQYHVIVDCNPSFTMPTRLSIIACKEIIIPTTLDEYSSGGLENVMTQLGGTANPNAGNFVTFRTLINQLVESDRIRSIQIGAVGMPLNLDKLEFAKIRTIVINKFPKSKNGLNKTLQLVLEHVTQLILRYYKSSPFIFATPRNEIIFHNPLNSQNATTEFVNANYIHIMCDIAGSMQISSNLGIAISLLSQERYRLQVPRYTVDDGVEVEDGALATFESRVMQDAVKYGLLIQDLVELTLNSTREHAYLLKGQLVAEDTGDLRLHLNYIVLPHEIPAVIRAEPADNFPSVRQRLGRRVLALELIFPNNWWRKHSDGPR